MDYRKRSFRTAGKLAVFILGLCFALSAQTRVPAASISYPPVQFVAVHILTPSGILLVQLDPSIVLDQSGPVPVLKAITVAAPVITRAPRRVEVFTFSAEWTAVTVSQVPDLLRELAVYRNGVRMAPAIDYTVDGRVVTFSVPQGTGIADIILVSYGPV